MGLFGLGWTIFMTSGKAIDSIKNKIEDVHNKNESLDGIMYYDHKGRRRLISNNHFCRDEYKDGYRRIIDVTDYTVVWDARDFEVPININQYKEDAENKGRTTFRCDMHKDGVPYNRNNGEIYGHQYKDFKTGRIYVIRVIDSHSFYVDIETNKPIRYTDYSIYRIKKTDEERERKRNECNPKLRNNYIPLIEEFKMNHSGRTPLEEYSYLSEDQYFKKYYNPKASGGYDGSYEVFEEKFNNKEN